MGLLSKARGEDTDFARRREYLLSRHFYHRVPVSAQVWDLGRKVEEESETVRQRIRQKMESNYYKVLAAFQRHQISDHFFAGSTGYGYGDSGRDALDSLYAAVFGAEAGLVRPQIVSGTHAITLTLFGILRPGDKLLFATGEPYDTLKQVIGYRGGPSGSLRDWGIDYEEVPLQEDGSPDYMAIQEKLSSPVKVVAIQRSRGYSLRPSFNIQTVGKIISLVKEVNPSAICLVDNCYGEFVESREPCEVGADLVVGSLIKNPGGGLAPAGGYIVGRASLLEEISHRLTAPGLGAELGASLADKRLFYQGLFMAPLIVGEALQGAVFAAGLFQQLGFQVSPLWDEDRADIIQAIVLGQAETLLAFCQGLQKASPVDSHFSPEPAQMPGYTDRVIMAGGTFIQGSSIELSADGPLREPYVAYLQGGLAYPYVKAALLTAVEHLLQRKLISL
jgi:cystathionine beta-lyase family protein involved in aluminum resistance